MERGAFTAALRRLDPAATRTPVRAEALAGLPAALGALVDGRVVEQTTATGERVLLASGARGAVACIAPARVTDMVAVVHSTAPEAVARLAEQSGVVLARPAATAAGLGSWVVTLLGGLDAAVAAARDQAAHRLHDGPVQELAAVQLVIDSAVPAGGGDVDVAGIQRGVELLRAALLSCRQLMSDLATTRSGP